MFFDYADHIETCQVQALEWVRGGNFLNFQNPLPAEGAVGKPGLKRAEPFLKFSTSNKKQNLTGHQQ